MFLILGLGCVCPNKPEDTVPYRSASVKWSLAVPPDAISSTRRSSAAVVRRQGGLTGGTSAVRRELDSCLVGDLKSSPTPSSGSAGQKGRTDKAVTVVP